MQKHEGCLNFNSDAFSDQNSGKTQHKLPGLQINYPFFFFRILDQATLYQDYKLTGFRYLKLIKRAFPDLWSHAGTLARSTVKPSYDSWPKLEGGKRSGEGNSLSDARLGRGLSLSLFPFPKINRNYQKKNNEQNCQIIPNSPVCKRPKPSAIRTRRQEKQH